MLLIVDFSPKTWIFNCIPSLLKECVAHTSKTKPSKDLVTAHVYTIS